MTVKKLKESLRKKLRDPAWQFVGVLITTVALLSPIIVNYLRNYPKTDLELNRLLIYLDTSKELTNFLQPVGTRTKVLVDGKEEQDLKLFVYLAEYKGDHPLRTADFDRPLRGTISATRKLIAVQKSSNLEGPYRLNPESNDYGRVPQPPITFEPQLLNQQTFEIKPALMNPGEWFRIEVYTAANQTNGQTNGDVENQEKGSLSDLLTGDVTWTCHLAGVSCPAERTPGRDYSDFNEPWYLQIYIYHRGWSVYFIVVSTILNLVLLTLLAKSAGLQKMPPLVQMLLFAFATISSMATSEVVAYWLRLDKPFSFESQIAHVFFRLHISAVLILLISLFLKRNKERKKRVRASTEGEDQSRRQL